jgi:hypothetical protein
MCCGCDVPSDSYALHVQALHGELELEELGWDDEDETDDVLC